MPLRVVELFAGVGGFRIGLEGPPGSPRDGNYKVVWSNQWEPSTKKQHAAEVYVERWGLTQSSSNPLMYHGKGETFVNDDIAKISDDEIPDHDLIVGGFPCQDYSVARTSAKGLEGVKGVLWWQIHRIMSSKRPKYAMLENVDRLLKSPTSQRGRDFAVMLASLAELGYIVEWRVINAADYGMPQRRRRVFILAYAPGTPQYEALKDESNIKQWIETDGTMAKAFPVKPLNILVSMPSKIKQNDKSDLADVSDNFNKGANPKSKSPFKKSGVMVGNNYYTYDTKPNYNGPHTNLSQVLLTPGKVPLEYVLEPDSVMKTKGWKYLKGAKDEPRKGRDDFTYSYKEGPMIFPDALDKPSRTIITGEGGATPSRFKHVVKFKPTKKMNDSFDLETKECQAIRKEFGLTKSEWLRRLTPIELERLNTFPDNHTKGPTDGKRAFFMGNALVVEIVKRFADELYYKSVPQTHMQESKFDCTSFSKIDFERTLLSEGEYTLVVSNQGQKRKLFPYADKINFEPQYSTKEDGIVCPHFNHHSKFLQIMEMINQECKGFVVSSDESIPKSGQSVQGITTKEFENLISIGECKNNVTARHGYCSNCNKKFIQWKKVRQFFSNRYFNASFIQKGNSESEIELLHNADDCWPLKIQSNDWVGFLKIPNHSIDECRLNILAHEDIVDAVMKWLDYCGNARCNHEKCARVDSFVSGIVQSFHQKISDATTMQYLLPDVTAIPLYNLHLDDNENVSADQMCNIINKLVDEFFPLSEFSSQTINLPMNHIAYYRRPQGQGKTDYQVPVRIVMASFALATALEESNRGDARWDRLKEGFTAYYANIWMPMGIFFLMRNGATLAKAKKAIKQA